MSFYQGSRLLEPLADSIGVPLDQVNFMLGQLVALALSFAYRLYLHPKDVGPNVRHAVAVSVGLLLGFFCFGQGFFHMIVQAGICYLLMKFAPGNIMVLLVFAAGMLYLSVMHIYRMTYDYGGYVLDVTGPLMMLTQRITSLAFNLHDGMYRPRDSLTPEQREHAVSAVPSPLVYASYMFYFQGLLAGPLCFYHDFIQFIEGSNYRVKQTQTSIQDNNDRSSEPDPTLTVIKKFLFSIGALYVAFAIAPRWPVSLNNDPDFIASHWMPYRIMTMILSITLARGKYYFAWKFGEAINNAAGLGFNGYNEYGEAEWDLVTNVHIRKLETATSLKVLLDNWNVQTALWLRRICYERAPNKSKTFLTYVLSAFWHGFYPGYYFCFVGAIPFTITARAVRRNIRPLFQTSDSMKFLYDSITWFFSQLSLAYLIVPFATLEFWPVIYFYTHSMYWFLHVLVFVVMFALPAKPKSRPTPQSAEKTAEKQS